VKAQPDPGELERDAAEQRDWFEIHWSVCRNRQMARWCQRCDDLDTAAHAAERVYLEASRG
jgi:hypothetical protein